MPPAIIGGAIAAVGAVGGAALSASAASKASKAASKSAAANNALQREQYQQNTKNLSPFMERGNAAGDQINALLGIGDQGSQVDWNAYVTQQPDLLKDWQTYASGTGQYKSMADYGQQHFLKYGGAEHRNLTGFQTPGGSGADAAFDKFRQSDGYQFRMNEGMNALNTGYAAAGKLQSGAAAKAMQRYGQDYGSNEFGKYLGYLGNQQGVGLTGASAVAGVGTNYANAVSQNNNNAADAAGNAALVKGSAYGNALGGVANGLGTILGSSYGKPQLPYDTRGF